MLSRFARIATTAVPTTLLMVQGCGESNPRPAAAQTPATSTPAAPTPVLDEYTALADALSGDLVVALMYVRPLAARLELGDAPAGEHDRVIAALRAAQPAIDKLTALSRRQLEAAPRQDPADRRSPGNVISRARYALLADASRCFEEGDHEGALRRVAALARIGAQLLRLRSGPDGGGVLVSSAAAGKARSLLEAGAKGSPEGRAELTAALGLLDPDAAAFAERWQREASAGLAELRSDLAGADGPAHLAALVEENGISQDQADAIAGLTRELNPTIAESLGSAVIIKPARRQSRKEIESALASAELLIPRVAAALRQPDLAAAFAPIFEALQADRTQIHKLAIGAPSATLHQLRAMDGERRAALALLRVD